VGDVRIETTFELRTNPDHVSAAGIAFRAADARNAYLAEVDLDGVVKLLARQDGRDRVLCERRLSGPLLDGLRYKLEVEAFGPMLVVRLDDVEVARVEDDTFANGRVGFYTPKEKWPLFDDIRVTNARGRVLLKDDFSRGSTNGTSRVRCRSWQTARSATGWSGRATFTSRSAARITLRRSPSICATRCACSLSIRRRTDTCTPRLIPSVACRRTRRFRAVPLG